LKRYVLQIGLMNDPTYVGVSHLVSRYPPFSHYSFQLMLEKIGEQLVNKSNVMMVIDGRVVAYAGWVMVDDDQAKRWLEQGGDIPQPNWVSGGSAIVTIVVTQDKQYIHPLIKAVSHVCAGKPVYRLRSFQNGRPDMRRPPIIGRVHSGLNSHESD
jgi:hemolysin-activating ACP:hemolysin acyltransferase